MHVPNPLTLSCIQPDNYIYMYTYIYIRIHAYTTHISICILTYTVLRIVLDVGQGCDLYTLR